MKFFEGKQLHDVLRDCKDRPSEEIESEIIEFKEYRNMQALHNCKKLPLEISAMANTDGGVIIIGVKDNAIRSNNYEHQLIGIDDFEPIDAKQRLEGKLQPKINIHTESIYFEGVRFGVIHVSTSRNTLVGTTGGKYYKRDGRSSRPMNPTEIEQAVKSLQNFDWSSDEINLDVFSVLDDKCWEEAYEDYCDRRKLEVRPTKIAFLESIGATRNGMLNKAGLLFLGKSSYINKLLGDFEYRFSWKKKNGDLLINEVWSGCIWDSLKKIKQLFGNCNQYRKYILNEKDFEVPILDEKAFHEALMNAIVHRDYALDGMIVVEFTDREMIIRNPGTFYGGVTTDNIMVHEPKHRNKTLASLLMQFSLVDRAGVGIKRISYRSLMYGRGFPRFVEDNESISVFMKAEALIPEIFVLTQDPKNDFSISSLFILNIIADKGFIRLGELEKQLVGITTNVFDEVLNSVDELFMLELVGNNDGIYIRIKSSWKSFFGRIKTVKVNTTSKKHVKIYKYLKKHGFATNEEITELLEHKYPSHTSQFLRRAKYLKKATGKKGKWFLRDF